MRSVVLASPSTDSRARAALHAALRRFPDTVPIEESALEDRAVRLRELAAGQGLEWIVVVDPDAAPHPDAFGSLQRTLSSVPALLGGRALVGATQRLGAMLAPSRSGPNPFDIAPIIALQTDRGIADLVRGPVDVPQRGLLVVDAAFVRSLAGRDLDPVLLHLDLAVAARAAGRAVLCEPAIGFTADEDSIEVRRRLAGIRKFVEAAGWEAEAMHRDAPKLRDGFIMREARIMGAIRGYMRFPRPPLTVLAAGYDELGRTRARRDGAALGPGISIRFCDASDGNALRRMLAQTGDTYVLVLDGAPLPTPAALGQLIERLERNGRRALALDTDAAPYRVALFHQGRIVNGGAFGGASVGEVIFEAIARLPERRLFAASPAGPIVPAVLPPIGPVRTLDIVYVAAARPEVTGQSIRSLLDYSAHSTTVVFPAGSVTTQRGLSVLTGIRLLPDDVDPTLAVGLNRALAECTADVVAVIRDDVQLPLGTLPRLLDAFRRIPGLGAAVPRVGSPDRPESLAETRYQSSAEMQGLFDRRALAFARESQLVDLATTPIVVVAKEALEVVGGFDERFGFSRVGVEDFTRRLRAANFLVARCDDVYVHLFSPAEAASLIGDLDELPSLRALYDERWKNASGFDPERDRVPLQRTASEAAAPQSGAVRILMPVADGEQWLRLQPLVAELAATLRATDPVVLDVGLTGTFSVQQAVGALRELLLAAAVPMEQTLNVNIDVIADVVAWRDAGPRNVRLSGVEHDDLAELEAVRDAAGVRALFREARA